MSAGLMSVIDQIVSDKGIDKETMIEAIKSAVVSATVKRYGLEGNIEAVIDSETNELTLLVTKKVVENVVKNDAEIQLEEAKKIKDGALPGDEIHVPVAIKDLGRIAAQTAKQVILQKVREAEQDMVYNAYKDKKGELVTGIVSREDKQDLFVELNKTEAILPKKEQSFREHFKRGERLKAYGVDVKKGGRASQIVISRTHPGFLVKLFELEVPEIGEGSVEIKGAAREPSGRSKIAVVSHKKDVDPVGSCVGMRGIRIQAIVDELCGEKIDIICWSENIEEYLKNALSPAKVTRVVCDADNRNLEAIVPDDQLSLAIGKKGQNVKLAVKLLHWNVDIKKESDYGERKS
ncbi:MAG: transcription termination factor NusA, partial [Nitrospinota bacterium]